MSTTRPEKRRLIMIGIVISLGFAVWWFRRGPTELERYKAQLLAQGEILGLDQLIPNHTNDVQLVVGGTPGLANISVNFNGPRSILGDGYWALDTNGLVHLATTCFSNRQQIWRDLGTVVNNERPTLAEIRIAAVNPARDTVANHHEYFSRNHALLAQHRILGYFCRSAAFVAIHANDREESYATTIGLLNLSEYRRDELTVTSQMIRIAVAKMAHEVTWYGLECRIWDEPKLLQLQTRWENQSFITNMYQALLMERAIGNDIFARAQVDRDLIKTQVVNNAFASSPTFADRFWQWWRLSSDLSADQLFYLQSQQAKLALWREQMQKSSWARAIIEFAELENARTKVLNTSLFPSQYLLTRNLDFGHSQLASTLIAKEIQRLQTITAIALERYRLANGHHSKTLAELIPNYLTQIPQDPMDGRPMRYRLNPDGTFTLWSVGFDGKDDGGDPTMPNPQKQTFPQDAKDLVWPKLDPVDLPPKK